MRASRSGAVDVCVDLIARRIGGSLVALASVDDVGAGKEDQPPDEYADNAINAPRAHDVRTCSGSVMSVTIGTP